VASYYYFVASLPTLFLDEELPIAPAEFLAACDRWLDADDARDIHCLLENRWECVKGACAARWLARETQIRNALVRLRAAKVRVDAEPFLRPCGELSLYVEKAVAAAMGKPLPLERELGLDELRWSLLEDMSRFDPFGLPAVIAYALKLKLVERWSALTAEKGQAIVEGYITQQLMGIAI
jgi:hypothetical protein